jgi:hypothetical protein
VPRPATETSFQVGWKGGPGRPRRDVAVPTANAVAKVARSFSLEALETLVRLMRDAELPGVVRLKAATAVLDRGLGLPSQSVEAAIKSAGPPARAHT